MLQQQKKQKPYYSGTDYEMVIYIYIYTCTYIPLISSYPKPKLVPPKIAWTK